MPKNKSHKGLAKRIKISKTGKIRFGRPHSRHLKSNKTLSKLLFRPLLSREVSDRLEASREVAVTA